MKHSASIRTACIYGLLLRLYPARYHREYGPLMEQLFRDQCRETLRRSGQRGLWGLWFHVLRDLIATVPAEHLTQLTHSMKTKNIDRLSVKFLAAAVSLSALAAPAAVCVGLAPVCLYLSTLALLARAFAEWYRPSDEWARGLLWMLGMLLIYSLIIPFWVKLHLRLGDAYPSVPIVDAGAIFLNAAIALLRPLISRLGGDAGGQVSS